MDALIEVYYALPVVVQILLKIALIMFPLMGLGGLLHLR
jgi:hypothetical protein